MKLQYMGDRRDFYKYDLLLHLATSTKLPNKITVIPMLTPDVADSGEGRLRSYGAGRRDRGVHSFVQSLVLGDPAGFQQVTDFFAQRNVPIKFTSQLYLERGNREAYFAAIDAKDLDDSIVFFDPDSGFETWSRSRRDARYLRYEELDAIWRRSSNTSIMVMYQHMPRKNHKAAIPEMLARAGERTSISRADFVDMGDLGFITAAHLPGAAQSLTSVLLDFASRRNIGVHSGLMGQATA